MALGIGPHTENAPPLSLPLSFFLTGLTGLIAALLVLLGNGPTLAAFLYQSTALLAATHLTTLGFVSLIMMGAMYQLVPVVLNTRLYSVRLGALHYALMVPGIGCLVAGFLTGITVFWLILGGSLIVVAVAVFLLNMAKTLSQARLWDVSGWYIASALGYLALTVTMGWLLAFNFAVPFLPVSSALPVHMALGLLGWFALTLGGVSYKLLPMFSLTHARPRYSWLVFCFMNAAVWTAAIGSWWTDAAPTVATALAGLGLLAYLADVSRLWRARLRRQADPPVLLALAGVAAGLAALVSGLLALLGLVSAALPAFLFFFGWLGLSVLGYLQKIVPFLVWLHRYSEDIGSRPVPRMRNVLPEAWSWRIGATYLAGVLTAAGGLAAGAVGILTAGLLVMAGGVTALLAAVVWVLTHDVTASVPAPLKS